MRDGKTNRSLPAYSWPSCSSFCYPRKYAGVPSSFFFISVRYGPSPATTSAASLRVATELPERFDQHRQVLLDADAAAVQQSQRLAHASVVPEFGSRWPG